MTDVIRARTLSDLIGAVPAMFGFHPEHSLVALCLNGARSQVGFRLRVDLPPPDDAPALAEALVGYLVAQQPEAVIVLAYADDDGEARPAVDALVARLEEEGVRLADAARFDGERFYSYSCDDTRCCPPEGVPCDVEGSAVLAEAVFRGMEILPDRATLARRFEPVTGAARDDVALAAGPELTALAACAAGAQDPQRDLRTLRRGLDRVVPVLDAVLEGDEDEPVVISAEDRALLAVWASLVIIRDVAWTMITHDNAVRSLELWRQVAVSAPLPFEVPALTLAAFAAWLSGDGAQAQCALDRVRVVAPDYSMAVLIQSALSGCLDPRSWVGMGTEEVLRSVPGLS
ncbi:MULTISPECIES: DUF4192 domain-containing protein [Mumia]|uniref:DUF4192 domain-containing protein n=1 Tax=Mumia TaxID=1546255 RepID=UPI00141E6804|nr:MULTISPECIES: DUF4192 domain-containing protein [unclassified Mumia]QMW67831.1 DUF4192 domain-containing protein [Mumia sp. ZJ1417]